MFLFGHLFRRLSSSTSKRRLLDVVRYYKCVELKFTNYSPDSAIKRTSLDGQNIAIEALQKVEKNITKYHKTTIAAIDHVLDSAQINRSLNEHHILRLLECCGKSFPLEELNIS